jgi:hypothetical protein
MDLEGSTIVIAFYAVLATIYAGWEQRQNNKLQARIVELEEARDRHRQLEESRARVEVSYRKEPGSGRSSKHFMVLTNRGQATAKDLAVTVNGESIESSQHTPTARNPVRVLGPGAEQAYLLYIVFMGPPSPLDIVATWRDDSGIEGSYQTQISV